MKHQKLIDGRYPNIFISAHVARQTEQQDTYIKNKAFDDEYYKDLILKYIEEYKEVERKDIDKLLLPKMSDVLDDSQKKRKIGNMLVALSKQNLISNNRKGSMSYWTLNN